MNLGNAISPLPERTVTSGIDRVVREYLAEQDNAARQMTAILEGLRAVAEQLVAVASALGSQQVVVPAPVVNVSVPEVEHETPVVNVQVDAPVTVQESEPKRSVKTVERDASGLIVRVVEVEG